MELSETEFERLVGLFPYPRKWNEHGLGAEARAALMANNTPAVARKWLEEEGLLDEQLKREGAVHGSNG
jgi:hypothetical protein